MTGPGGSGKTRLAVEAARDLVDEFPDGVYWVPLQLVADPKLLEAGIAGAIGAQGDVARHVGDKRMLLLLDNFEQLIGAAVDVAALLAKCANVVVLATSREPLHVAAEREYAVQPMSQEDAVSLFSECAVNEGPESIVADICRRIDNLPLAVELAAARTRAFTHEEILARLDERLAFLAGGPRDAPVRQQTLRATIAWSYDHLPPTDQQVFERLGVFAGGCSPDAAEGVCQATADDLQSLVDRNLLVRAGRRHAMLDTIQEFAVERLGASGQSDAVSLSHKTWFLELVESFAADNPHRIVSLKAWQAWWPRLKPELDNIRAVLRRLIDRGERTDALRLASMLGPVWESSWSLQVEGQHSLTDAIDLHTPADQTWLGRAHFWLASLLEPLTPRRQASLGEALRIARNSRDLGLEWDTLIWLSFDASQEADFKQARRLVRQLPKLPTDDRRREFWSIHLRAEFERDAGNLNLSRHLFEQALQAARTIDYAYLCKPLHGLGDVYFDEGSVEAAEEVYKESLRLTGSYDQHQPDSLTALAATAAVRGDLERAGKLWGAAGHYLETLGGFMFPADRMRYTRILENHTESAFVRGVDEGRRLDFDDAIAYALGETVVC